MEKMMLTVNFQIPETKMLLKDKRMVKMYTINTYHVFESKLLVDKYQCNKMQTQVYVKPYREFHIILLSAPDL
jgi:hypothetical protein